MKRQLDIIQMIKIIDKFSKKANREKYTDILKDVISFFTENLERINYDFPIEIRIENKRRVKRLANSKKT